MAQKIVFLCDGCGHEKGEVNHWFETYENQVCWEVTQFSHIDAAKDSKIKIYCGQQCVMKAFSEYLERQRGMSRS